MIFLFHGENQPALRDALLELKKGYRDATFWEKAIDELEVYLVSPTLFSVGSSSAEKQELLIIEDPELGYLNKLVGLVKRGSKDVAIVFCDKVPSGKLPRGEGLQIRYFREEIPQNIFPFLDALAMKDRKKAFTEAHRLLREGEDLHFLLAMVVWQLRNLARVKGGAPGHLHPYVLRKLRRLEKNFESDELSRAFSLLLKEDLAIKKGKANSATFDFLIDKLIG